MSALSELLKTASKKSKKNGEDHRISKKDLEIAVREFREAKTDGEAADALVSALELAKTVSEE